MKNFRVIPTIEREQGIRKLEIWIPEATPSWKNYGTGTASLKVTSHLITKFVSLHAVETAHAEHPKKKNVRKEVFVTLYGDDARLLFEMLKEVFEPSTDVE